MVTGSSPPPSWDTVADHLHARSAALWNLPAAEMDVDPFDVSLGIRVADHGQPLPDVTGYRHLTSRRVYVDAGSRLELRVAGASLLSDGYRLLVDVAAALETGRVGFAAAVRTALERLHELLHRSSGLPLHREIGLWGELHVLESAAAALGPYAALTAWQGPSRGEHDFTLDEADLEVKTTTSELRHHRITSLTQLSPLPGRDLWLLSVRITRSNGEGSRTLHEQIRATQDGLGELAHHLDELADETAVDQQWAPRWRLRDHPDLYRVDAAFPGLTSDKLTHAGIDITGLLAVEQTIDLENRPSSMNGPEWLCRSANQKDTT